MVRDPILKRTAITRDGEGGSSLCAAVDAAFFENRAKLPERLLGMAGMSGRLYRIFINNLIGMLADARYLEIGCFTGSTTCAALYGNRVEATCIDHWQQFGGKDKFAANTALVRSANARITVMDSDFRAVDYQRIGRHNIYLYDAGHSARDHTDALRQVHPAVDSEFVFIVDDWNWDRVRAGTWKGLEAIGARKLRSYEIRTTFDERFSGSRLLPRRYLGPRSEWHNGYLIGVFSRA